MKIFKNALWLLLVISCIIASSCESSNKDALSPDADEIGELLFEEQQRPLVMDFTSTGCPGCGSWGKPAFRSFLQRYDNITPMAIHIKYNDPMINQHGNKLAANRRGQWYTPQIWVQDSNIVVLRGGIDGTASMAIGDTMISREITTTPIAKVGVVAAMQAGKITVQYGVELPQNTAIAPSRVFLACYLLEHGIVYRQAGYAGGEAVHDFVLRQAVGNTFGTNIEELESISTHALQYRANHIFNVPSDLLSRNFGIAVVVWEFDGTYYRPINSNIIRHL